MAINPNEITGIKKSLECLYQTTSQIPQFLSAVQQAGIPEGTIIEVQITSPDGKTFTSNMKVTSEDIDAVKSYRITNENLAKFHLIFTVFLHKN